MKKLSLTQFRKALKKSILGCSEEEVRFVFNIMGFDLKEFSQETGRINFEVHYRRYYIIKVEVIEGVVLFSNPWVVFNDNKDAHHINFQFNGPLLDLLSMFLDLFGPSFLKPLNYQPAFIDGWSACAGPEEGKMYWDIISDMAKDAMVRAKAQESGKNIPS